MRLGYRFQAWLADRITWVQYPGLQRLDTSDHAYFSASLSNSKKRKRNAWTAFFVFWGLVVLASILGTF